MGIKLKASNKTKKCSRCLLYHYKSNFYIKNGRYDSLCKGCRKLTSKEWRQKNRTKHRADSRQYNREHKEERKAYLKQWRKENKGYQVRNRLGLSKQEHQQLLKDCKHKCCICGSKRNLCVDHNHKTGQVRGILCQNCNRGVGLIGESIRTLKRAIIYLQER
jgi:hypothetical protein